MQELNDERGRLDALVSAMASYLAIGLTLQDPECVPNSYNLSKAHTIHADISELENHSCWKAGADDEQAAAIRAQLRIRLPKLRLAKFTFSRCKNLEYLIETLNNEARYLPTKERLQYLGQMRAAYEKCRSTDHLSTKLLKASGCDNVNDGSDEEDGYGEVHDRRPVDDEDDGTDDAKWRSAQRAAHDADCETGAVAISPYVNRWGFFQYSTPIERVSHLTVGGIGRRLRASIAASAASWLLDCEKVISSINREETAHDDALACFAHKVAFDIASKITLHEEVVDHGGDDPSTASTTQQTTQPTTIDHLSPSYLEARNSVEYARTKLEARIAAHQDLLALRALQVLAREGGRTAKSRLVLTDKLPLLAIVVRKPPIELGLRGENAKRMNLLMLDRVIEPNVLQIVREKIASHWQSRHGAYAQTAISEAIVRLEGFSTKEPSNFIPVISMKRTRHATMLPSPPFAPWTAPMYALPAVTNSTRSGLDTSGRRLVRLSSLVWQLVASPSCVFERGVIHRNFVIPCAMEALQVARVTAREIETERMKNNCGCRLQILNQSIQNRSSELADDLDGMMTCLSGFSLTEIMTAFRPDRPLLAHLIGPLTARTREITANRRKPVIPSTYLYFANDMLATLLPAIRDRRLAFNKDAEIRPHPFGDLLRNVSEIKTWSPLDGPFVFDLELLKRAPKLREALEYYARMPDPFVNAPHLTRTASGRARHAPVEFHIESAKLVQLLLL